MRDQHLEFSPDEKGCGYSTIHIGIRQAGSLTYEPAMALFLW